MNTPRSRVMVDIALVAASYGVSVDDLMTGRSVRASRARQAAMWLVWWSRGWSSLHVSRFFRRDHATVLYGIGKHMSEARIEHHLVDFYQRHVARTRAFAVSRARRRRAA